jgi:hypothetical protein
MLAPADDKRVRQAVRQSILEMLQADADGHTENLKEAWEECSSIDEQRAAQDEMRQIIALIHTRM